MTRFCGDAVGVRSRRHGRPGCTRQRAASSTQKRSGAGGQAAARTAAASPGTTGPAGCRRRPPAGRTRGRGRRPPAPALRRASPARRAGRARPIRAGRSPDPPPTRCCAAPPALRRPLERLNYSSVLLKPWRLREVISARQHNKAHPASTGTAPGQRGHHCAPCPSRVTLRCVQQARCMLASRLMLLA